jgi:phosphatidate cytidylyltransferase
MSSERTGLGAQPTPQRPVSRIGADLWPRVGAAIVLAAVALVATWAGGFAFVALWWAASALVFWEWQRLIRAEKLIERVILGLVALAVAAIFAMNGSIFGAVAALAIGAAAVGWLAGPDLRVWAGAGTVYAGALVVSLALLRASPHYGLAAILWLFAVVWGADIAAYFAGRLIGGPRLWPRVSPGKTWSGAVVGALAGAACGLIVIAWTNRADLLFWLGLTTAIVSQLGDLFESAVKRRFGAKDSGGLIPGHGGLMDRLDAFIAASLFAAIFAALETRGSYLASGLFEWR